MISDEEYQRIEDSFAELLSDALGLVDEIQDHTLRARAAMDTDPVDGNTLSNEIVELSICNQRLGDRVSKAGMLMRETENYYKAVREDYKVRLTRGQVKGEDKMAAGVADSMKMTYATKEFSLANQAEELFDRLNFLRKSTDKTIDAIRSKLSYEKTDQRNS